METAPMVHMSLKYGISKTGGDGILRRPPATSGKPRQPPRMPQPAERPRVPRGSFQSNQRNAAGYHQPRNQAGQRHNRGYGPQLIAEPEGPAQQKRRNQPEHDGTGCAHRQSGWVKDHYQNPGHHGACDSAGMPDKQPTRIRSAASNSVRHNGGHQPVDIGFHAARICAYL